MKKQFDFRDCFFPDFAGSEQTDPMCPASFPVGDFSLCPGVVLRRVEFSVTGQIRFSCLLKFCRRSCSVQGPRFSGQLPVFGSRG
jgi:hypothetical protein